MKQFHCLFRRRMLGIHKLFDDDIVDEIYCQSFSQGEGCIYYSEKHGCSKQDYTSNSSGKNSI